MAIKTEFYRTREDGVNLYRTYSDEGFYIVQNEAGVEYGEAIDIEGTRYTYSESDKKIEIHASEPTEPEPEPDETATYAELAQVYKEGVNGIE